jgi:hypothetical protein
METKYYDSANLFSPRIKTDRSPDYRGDVELSAELCAYIVNKVKHGETPKISLSMWAKEGRSGQYYNCKVRQGWEQNEAKKSQPVPPEDLSDIPF